MQGQGSLPDTQSPCWFQSAPSRAPHLLHCSIAAGQLLAEVSDVVVTLFHVFLEILTEVHQGLLHLTVKL